MELFIARLMKRKFDQNLFNQFCSASQNATHKPIDLVCPTIDIMPKEFLQSWFDPCLGGVNKDEMLSWMTASVEAIMPANVSLTVQKQAIESS